MLRVSAVVALFAGCHPSPEPPPPVHRAPPLAVIDPAAVPLLDAWAAAAGGRDMMLRWSSLHSRGRLRRGGLDGTFETRSTARGAVREEVTVGFLHETRVFDGIHGWLVDRNREVRPLAGVELDDELDTAFLDAAAPLLPERLPGTVTRNPDGTLLVTPTGSHRPVTITLDPITHLPARLTHRDGEKLHVTTLADYRRVGGVAMPFAIHDEDGDPQNTVDLALTSIDDTQPNVSYSRPADRPTPDAVFANGATSTEFPIELALGSLTVVNATVRGKSLSMIVDSGAEGTVLNAARLGNLGLTGIGAFGVGAGGGDTVASYVEHVTFELPGVTLRDQIVAAIHFELLESMFGRPIDGILGYDFLSRFVVELDYPNRVMRLHDRAGYHHDGAPAIPISLEGSTPMVDASIDLPDHTRLVGHYTVDTGCGCEVSFTTPFTDSNHLLELFDVTLHSSAAGAGGATEEMAGEISALHVGAITIDKPTADFARDQIGATNDPETAGLIGALIFRKFRLVLDYRGGRMWLDPSS